MATPSLPLDVITDILSRLPSKTLIRFKSVSKQWYSLINSLDFVNLHLSQTLISQNHLNLIVSHFSLFSSTISDNQNYGFYFSELDHPLKPFCKNDFSHYDDKFSPKILGSINGVVCISLYNDNSSVFLYNPSTKTHRLIPPQFEMTHGNDTANLVVFGFGFDSVSRDYKVVRMSQTLKNNVVVYRQASVYSLKDDSWKCVTDQTIMSQCVLQNGKTVLVNESLHFIVFDSSSNFKIKMKCFNLGTEIFSIFELPKLDWGFSGRSYVFKEFGGCFSMWVNYENPVSGMEADLAVERADLWLMKEHGNEESWFRLFSIRNQASTFGVLSKMTPIVYSKDKVRVLLELDDSWFGWYSWGNKKFERVTVHGLPSNFAPCITWTFSDSLVSLRKSKNKDTPKTKIMPKKNKNKMDRDDFLSSGFKLRL